MENDNRFQSDLALSSFHRRLFTVVNHAPDGFVSKPVRLQHRLKEDIGFIRSLSASHDGSLLALASKGLAIVLDVEKETELMRYKVSPGKVTSVNLCRTGRMWAIGDTEGRAIVHDLELMKVVRIYPHHSAVVHVHQSREGDLLAVASGTKALVYSNVTGQLVREITCDSAVNSVCLNSESDNIFIEKSTCTELWGIRTHGKKGRFTDHGEANASPSSSGMYLLFKSIGKDALLWDVTTGKMLKRFRHPSTISALAFSGDPRRSFVTASEDGKVHVFDAAAGQHPATVLRHSDDVPCVDITGDGRRIFSGCEAVRVWDRETAICLKTFKGYGSHVIVSCLAKDEQLLLIGGGDGVLRMYDLHTGYPVRRFEVHSGWISAIALSEDSRIAATASHDNTACVFSLSGEVIHRLKGHDDCLHAVAICPENRIIATGGRDNRIVLWSIETGERKSSWTAHRDWVRSLSFSRDGKYLLSAGDDGMARLWESSTKDLLAEYGFHSDGLYSAVLSPDGLFVATAGQDAILKIFNLDGSIKQELRGHVGGVRKVIFHRDGTLISVSLDCTARRWDPENGECLMTYRDLHSDWIRTVSVTSNGVLILGSKDGTLSFSDLETGKRLATLYNLDKGFLWTCPRENESNSGWFWTDREELIEVMEVDGDGKSVLSAANSQGRKDHISLCNSMTRVMSRIRNKGRDSNQFERLMAMHRECMGSGRHSGLLPSPDMLKDHAAHGH